MYPQPPTTFRNARLAKRLEWVCSEVTPLTARKMLDIELESACRSAGKAFGTCRAELVQRQPPGNEEPRRPGGGNAIITDYGVCGYALLFDEQNFNEETDFGTRPWRGLPLLFEHNAPLGQIGYVMRVKIDSKGVWINATVQEPWRSTVEREQARGVPWGFSSGLLSWGAPASHALVAEFSLTKSPYDTRQLGLL